MHKAATDACTIPLGENLELLLFLGPFSTRQNFPRRVIFSFVF